MARYRLIACEVFCREFEAVISDVSHQVDTDFVEQGLHDRRPETMSTALQERIDACDDDGYDAILLGYGLCNNGISGLQAKGCPLVVPRAHDCITLFLGDLQRYEKEFKDAPGSYYLSSGWIERANRPIESLPTRKDGEQEKASVYQQYVEKFGEENAKYLMETLGNWHKDYGRMVYISFGLGDEEAYRAHTKSEAEKRGLEYAEIKGDLRLFRELVEGSPWDSKSFQVLELGQAIKPVYDGTLIGCSDCSCGTQSNCATSETKTSK